MILHTTIPQELIFGRDTTHNVIEQSILYNGVPMMVEPVSGSEFRITRILSTNPYHYLDQQLTPGATLSLWS